MSKGVRVHIYHCVPVCVWEYSVNKDDRQYSTVSVRIIQCTCRMTIIV